MVQSLKSTTKALYLPNLNGVRFIAAAFVLIHHIEQYKETFGFTNHLFYTRIVRLMGPLGVFLFFVLSGFLITTLLLVEKDRTGTINIKNFYLRRILRIWPLYFLIVILGIFVFPNISFFSVPGETEYVNTNLLEKLVLYVLILPNIVTGVFKHIPFVSQTWSIGVEEQFYSFWPWVIRDVSKKRLLFVMILFFGAFFVLRSVAVLYIPTEGGWKYLSEFLKSLRISCMILGAVGAYLTHFYLQSKVVAFIFSRYFQLALYASLVLFFAFGFYLFGINQEVYSLLFTLIIMNLAKNRDSILNLERPILDFLGKISYGIYMYHTIAVVIAIKTAMSLNTTNNWLVYSIAFTLTIVIAWLSYSNFEKPFLTTKDRFAVVKTDVEDDDPISLSTIRS